jgi:hypothetical protein
MQRLEKSKSRSEYKATENTSEDDYNVMTNKLSLFKNKK